MAVRTLVLATLAGLGLVAGCRTAGPEIDCRYVELSQAITSTSRTPLSFAAEAARSPVVDALAGPHTVKAYIDFALAQNPAIQAARQRVQAAAMRVPQAASLADPMLDVTGWPFFPNTPQTASGRMTVDVMVSQQVPWHGKLSAQARAAEQSARTARAELAAQELETKMSVELAYYDLYYVQQAIDTMQRDQQFLSDLIEIADSRYRTGSASQQDVLRLQAELSTVDGELIRMQQMRDSARASLASALHVSPETPLETSGKLDKEDLSADLDELYHRALANRPELHAQLATIQRDRHLVDRALLEYRPDLTFKFGWGEMTTNRAVASSADGIDNLAAGLSVNLPIYRQRLDAAVREAEAQALASARQYDLMKDQTQREVKTLLSAALSQRDLAALLRDSIIPKTEQAFELAVREYQVGESEFADLLGTWRELLRFHLAELQQQTELRKSIAALERVLGSQLPDSRGPDDTVAPQLPAQP